MTRTPIHGCRAVQTKRKGVVSVRYYCVEHPKKETAKPCKHLKATPGGRGLVSMRDIFKANRVTWQKPDDSNAANTR